MSSARPYRRRIRLRDSRVQHNGHFRTSYGTTRSRRSSRWPARRPRSAPRRLRAACPVRRSPVVMRDCQDVYLLVSDQIGQVIGEARHGCSSNVERFQEHGAKAGTPVLVPARGIGELRHSFRPESDRPPHSLRRSATRSRAVGQSTVAASPERIRDALRSSSKAQTAIMVAGSSTAGESRLASSWTARSARSSSRSARASRRIVSVSEVTTRLYEQPEPRSVPRSLLRRSWTDHVSSQS
jgi:hypothetical protein